MKNSKMLTRGRLITKPQTQEWMERCIRSFASQLQYLSQTADGGTSTEQRQRFLTVLSERFDDNLDWIPELNVRVMRVPKGQEGAIVILEQL